MKSPCPLFWSDYISSRKSITLKFVMCMKLFIKVHIVKRKKHIWCWTSVGWSVNYEVVCMYVHMFCYCIIFYLSFFLLCHLPLPLLFLHFKGGGWESFMAHKKQICITQGGNGFMRVWLFQIKWDYVNCKIHSNYDFVPMLVFFSTLSML